MTATSLAILVWVFYSAFMVADKVEAITKSYQEDAPSVTWTCEGDPEYTLRKK